MKAKLLSKAGDIVEGTEVEIASRAGTNDARSERTWEAGAPPPRRSTR